MKVSTSKEQLAIAKRKAMPLVCIGIDDQHVPKEKGGRYGSITYAGPLRPDLAEEFIAFMTELFKKQRER